jgi:hypothetical protein
MNGLSFGHRVLSRHPTMHAHKNSRWLVRLPVGPTGGTVVPQARSTRLFVWVNVLDFHSALRTLSRPKLGLHPRIDSRVHLFELAVHRHQQRAQADTTREYSQDTAPPAAATIQHSGHVTGERSPLGLRHDGEESRIRQNRAEARVGQAQLYPEVQRICSVW